MTASAHRCNYPGCRTLIHARRWACRRHWESMPTVHRAAIDAFYDPRKEPSPNLIAAEERFIVWLDLQREKKS